MSSDGKFMVPACTRCSIRKMKCSRSAPACSACTKAGSECLIEDRSRKRSYSRQYVQSLIDEIQALEATECSHDSLNGDGAPSESNGQTEGLTDGATEQVTPRSSVRNQRFVGNSTTVSFLRYVFESGYWKPAEKDQSYLLGQNHALSKQPGHAYDWPPFEVGQLLVDSYLSTSHVLHPFLQEDDLRATFQRVYRSGGATASAADAFLLLMVFAVGSVRTFRDGLTEHHPYGYFIAAQKHLKHVPLLGDLKAVQNLLLIARFGIYYDIGTSLWALSHTCMRQCIDLGLHHPPNHHEPLEDQQLKRYVFWDCYLNERFCSGFLGRPSALPDEDIRILLPWEASNEELRSHDSVTDFATHSVRQQIMACCGHVGLAHWQGLSFHIARTHSTQGTSTSCRTRPHRWLKQAPRFASPTSMYHSPEWYAFMVEKEKLSVLRASLTRLAQFHAPPPTHILKLCSLSALKVTELFGILFDSWRILPTRIYFEAIFVAGLSLVFCNSLESALELRAESFVQPRREVSSALSLCSRNLLLLSKELPDSQNYYLIFETLRRKFDRQVLVQHSPGKSSPTKSSGVAQLANEPMHSRSQNPIVVSESTAGPAGPESFMVGLSDLEMPDNLLDLDTSFSNPIDWNLSFSEEQMSQIVAEIEDYLWDQPS
ncbi:hypothetical protein M409DRAFT_27123 [Zasmidium cellare ATCC 36951]|uniref:Zn(2)-C6 fungal-type domain-containing protein n=1 Tax=Zasmidium cellare ATCC 36951 TaxID=1080233 RepID=A0A6A6C8D5_ZASCE|nr:uncharacterized protein M409DRAFT_27123 [Zasmidium cellare ATCC 36951]KAF2162500.1 hypothetical protein M409DRAFT_27123 [Zasmidium cellare ATCC 36951]